MPSILMNTRSVKPNEKCHTISRSSTLSSNDASSWLSKSCSYHGSSFLIRNYPDTQEISISIRGLSGYRLIKEPGILGKKYSLFDDDSLTPLYHVRSHRILGYLEISSPKFMTSIHFPYPSRSRNSYRFQMAGMKYSWECIDDQNLKCYNSDMVIIAQIYFGGSHSNRSSVSSISNESDMVSVVNKPSAKLVIVPQPHFQVAHQTLLTLTGLMLLKHLYWS